jgi:hypothetical protein
LNPHQNPVGKLLSLHSKGPAVHILQLLSKYNQQKEKTPGMHIALNLILWSKHLASADNELQTSDRTKQALDAHHHQVERRRPFQNLLKIDILNNM